MGTRAVPGKSIVLTLLSEQKSKNTIVLSGSAPTYTIKIELKNVVVSIVRMVASGHMVCH
jgi:hypothetical protein